MKALTYRRKLSLTLLALLLIPMLMFSYLLMYHNIKDSENQLLEHYARLTSNSMDFISNSLDSCMLRFDAIEKDSRLHGYLNSIDNSLVDLVEINYYINALYSTLTFGEVGMDVTIYRSLVSPFPEGCVKPVDDLHPDLLSECLRLVPGSTLIRYDTGGFFRLFRLNKRINQDKYFIVEIRLPFPKFQTLFSSSQSNDEFSAIYQTHDGITEMLTEPQSLSMHESYIFEYTIHQVNLGYRYDLTQSFTNNPADYTPEPHKNGVFVFFVANTPIYSGVIIIAVLLIGLFVSVVVLVLFISKQLTNRLYYVVDQIRHQYETGSSISVDIIGNKKDEFHIINSKLSELFETVRCYYEDINNMTIEKKELETQLLQDLINPHFLYNTLDAIK